MQKRDNGADNKPEGNSVASLHGGYLDQVTGGYIQRNPDGSYSVYDDGGLVGVTVQRCTNPACRNHSWREAEYLMSLCPICHSRIEQSQRPYK